MKVFLTLIIITASAVGCKKSELTKYEQPDMIYIYKDASNTNRDSISYSFAIKPASLKADTVKVPLRIMGLAKNVDREVKVRVVTDSSTAVAGQHFDILPTIIKAGEYTANIPVLVKRAASMKTTEFRLMLEVIESADFKPGVPSTAAVSPRAGGSLRILIKMNDYFTKPSNWDSFIVFYLGTYSQVKYGFVINVTGRSEFLTSGTDPVSSSQMTYYKILCKNALATYEGTNGPLLDEFNAQVTFPN